MKQAPHVTENFETGEETKRIVSSVRQIWEYGFRIAKEEQKANGGMDQGERTIFVNVSTYPRKDGKLTAELYYGPNHAKFNITTEAELMARFPKSFAKLDCQDEYTELRKVYK